MRTIGPSRWKPPATIHVAPDAAADLERDALVARHAGRPPSVFAASNTWARPMTLMPLHVLQVGRHRLGDARADPLVGRLARDVGERHHRHRALAGLRVGRPSRGAAERLAAPLTRPAAGLDREPSCRAIAMRSM